MFSVLTVNFFRANKMKKLTAILTVLFVLISAAALALDIDQAKTQGLVGEKPDGYLGVVVKNAAAEELVDRINVERKLIYMQLAKKNNLALEQVQGLAAEKAYSKTLPGNYLLKSGAWVKQVSP